MLGADMFGDDMFGEDMLGDDMLGDNVGGDNVGGGGMLRFVFPPVELNEGAEIGEDVLTEVGSTPVWFAAGSGLPVILAVDPV